MRFVPWHLRDYATATAHLSLVEDAIYRRLLDVAYETERPLPDDVAQLARQIRATDHVEIVRAILSEFFILDRSTETWRHLRVEEEIEKFHAKSSQARAAVAARWEKRKAIAEASAITPAYSSEDSAPSMGGNGTDAIRTYNGRNTDALLPNTQEVNPLPNPPPPAPSLPAGDSRGRASGGAIGPQPPEPEAGDSIALAAPPRTATVQAIRPAAPIAQPPASVPAECGHLRVLSLPDWLPRAPWWTWARMRCTTYGLTPRAAVGVIRHLAQLREQGHDPGRLLMAAFEAGLKVPQPIAGRKPTLAGWQFSEALTDAAARAAGCYPARPGESMADYRARIAQALDRAGRGPSRPASASARVGQG